MRKTLILMVVFSLLLSMVFSSCAAREEKAGEGGKAPEVYKIGAVLSVSGAASPLGIPEKNTLELLEKKINDEGGIDGVPIEIIIEDDETDPGKAAQAARKLIQQDGVIAIIGATITPSSLSIKEVVNEEGIPMISLSAGNPVTEGDYRWVFRTAPKDAVAVATILSYIEELGNIKKVAVLHDSNAFGQSGADEIQATAGDYGLEVVAVEKYETNAPDLTAQLNKIKQANPDAVIVWGTNPGPAIAAKTMKQLDMNIPYFGSHGIANAKFIELAGDAAEGVIFPAGKLLVPEAIEESDPVKQVVDEFIAEYSQEYGENPNTFAGHAYDAFMILVDALKKVKSTDPEEIRSAIEETTDFVGCDGVFGYSPEDHDGIAVDDMIVVKIENGSWKRVK